MKHWLIGLLLFLAVPTMAQKQISVIDDETHKPIAYAMIADSLGKIAQTSLQGIALVPKHKGEIIIVQDNYDRMTFDYDTIPSVVKMHRREYTLDEVEVVGAKEHKIDMKGLGLDNVDIADAKAKASGGNLLSWLSDKIFNRKDRKRKKHREELAKILEDY